LLSAVVSSHVFPGLVHGGFVWVDVLFVISGYLITGLILKDLDRGHFSIGDSYGRRIRRISPALVLLFVFCLALGWLVLLDDEYKMLGKHVTAGAGFVANFAFWGGGRVLRHRLRTQAFATLVVVGHMKNLSSWLSNSFPRAGWAAFVALLSCSVVLAWLSDSYPLSQAHWDAPIHLLSGKLYSEGKYLPRLREHAVAVHDDLMRGAFPGEYWEFVRLGHIVLVGTVVQMFGTDAVTIGIVAGFYGLVFAIGLSVAAMFSVALVRAMAPTMSPVHVRVGACISLVLYLMSDVARYMTGNPVSEVPAILFLGLSAWMLVIAFDKQSPAYAAISGCLAFMLYAVRAESVWLYVSLLGAFAVHTWTAHARRREWLVLTVAAGASALLYLAYSWVFFPLTDPRLFGAFARTGVNFNVPLKGWIGTQVFAANGLLWVGAIAALPMVTASRAARLGALWLALAIVPVAGAITLQITTQTRMFTTLLPPVFLLSTVAWSQLVMVVAKGGPKLKFVMLLCLCLAGVLISQPASYSYLRSLPGMWRLQSVREYVAVYGYERIDYHLPELARMRQIIDGLEQPLTVIASPEMQRADHIMIMQFLQRSHNHDDGSRSIREDDPKLREFGGLDVHLAERLPDDVRFVKAHANGSRILLVGTAAEESWFAGFSGIGDIIGLYSTNDFKLVEVKRNASE